jgi:hypothetical protein
MIEGIKIQMTTEQLRDHVAERADFHANKAEWYRKNADNLRDGGLKAEANISNDPTSSLERSCESHRERATFFRIIAVNLIPDETYRLSESDLARLELFSRYY